MKNIFFEKKGTVLPPITEKEKEIARRKAAHKKSSNASGSSSNGKSPYGSPYVSPYGSPRTSNRASPRSTESKFESGASSQEKNSSSSSSSSIRETDLRIVSCDVGGMLMLWEGIEDAMPAMTLRAHDVTIHDCHFSPDGLWILTCSEGM